ncbi:MAG: rhodanese-like domain-containing protein [Flavobacteriaceae bacterium]|jgi:rhodanese-related sulfurtransferase|uniref:Rhodanese-like domain-containing protein n=1 Tax=Flavobacterium kayseriense TaxID=2764714 RepID=A0ABR7J9E7_9FLAO|nr:rhodanese-like domain-containing protein [Flavobacterium kayseriense]MBC5842116.1 rhodanese-like domain-containing protein [Flavobacterium kayseriense]MBC5848646.1 rhodanese-like domain-containing protein [Flavobacterium kayseriense]MBX9889376.1 rhodanese-like domain-containing protein [Flavobacteriaceae bacterium]
MKIQITLIVLLLTTFVQAQNTIAQELDRLNNKTVPYISVQELQAKPEMVVLDAREPKEFNTSHIKNAIFVGYSKFDKTKVTKKVNSKNTPIAVYCSIGVRSEKIAEKLQKMGYKNVYNLYGGIFEYKNANGTVYNNQKKATDSVHTYNKRWSQYLDKGIKVYEN